MNRNCLFLVLATGIVAPCRIYDAFTLLWHIIRHIYFSCKLWKATKIVRLELSEKILNLRKHEDLILNIYKNTNIYIYIYIYIYKNENIKIWLPSFKQAWHLNDMKMLGCSVSFLLFLFRTNRKKWHLNENDFRHCYGNSSSMFKVHYQQLIHFFYGNVSNILTLS